MTADIFFNWHGHFSCSLPETTCTKATQLLRCSEAMKVKGPLRREFAEDSAWYCELGLAGCLTQEISLLLLNTLRVRGRL